MTTRRTRQTREAEDEEKRREPGASDRETPSKSRSKRLSRSARTQQASPARDEDYSNKKTPKRRGQCKSWSSAINSPSNEAEQQHEIFWDPNSPTSFRLENGKKKQAARKCTVEISEIVNRIAPKNEKPTSSDAAYLGIWIGEDAIPCTPVVSRPRTKLHRSRILKREEELMELAKQLDRNLVEHKDQHVDAPDTVNVDAIPDDDDCSFLEDILEEDEAQALKSVSQRSGAGPAAHFSQDGVNREAEEALNALFDCSTQKFTGSQGFSDISTTSSIKALTVHKVTGSGGAPLYTRESTQNNKSSVQANEKEQEAADMVLSVSSSQDDFEDDWGEDILEDDSFVMQITQNPELVATPKSSGPPDKAKQTPSAALGGKSDGTTKATASKEHSSFKFVSKKMDNEGSKLKVSQGPVTTHTQKASQGLVSTHTQKAFQGHMATHTQKAPQGPVTAHTQKTSHGPVTAHTQKAFQGPVNTHSQKAFQGPVTTHTQKASHGPVTAHTQKSGEPGELFKLPVAEQGLSGRPTLKQNITMIKSSTNIPKTYTFSSKPLSSRGDQDQLVKKTASTVNTASTNMESDEWDDPKFSDEVLDMFCKSDSLWDDKDDDDDDLLYQVCNDVERLTQVQVSEEPTPISSSSRKGSTKIISDSTTFPSSSKCNNYAPNMNKCNPKGSSPSSVSGNCLNTFQNSSFQRTNQVSGTFNRSNSMPSEAECMKAKIKAPNQQNSISSTSTATNSQAPSKYSFTRIKPSQAPSLHTNMTLPGSVSGAKGSQLQNFAENNRINTLSNVLPSQSSLKRHLSESTIHSSKVFVSEDRSKKCSMQEIERKKQEALARRQMKARASSSDHAPT